MARQESAESAPTCRDLTSRAQNGMYGIGLRARRDYRKTRSKDATEFMNLPRVSKTVQCSRFPGKSLRFLIVGMRVYTEGVRGSSPLPPIRTRQERGRGSKLGAWLSAPEHDR